MMIHIRKSASVQGQMTEIYKQKEETSMSDYIAEKIDQIMQQVLLDEPDIDRMLFRNRINLLYSAILEEIFADDSDYDAAEIIEQIQLFEQSQLYFTETNLSQYKDITPDVAFDVFSNVAFSLAVERLKGKNYLGLSEMLSTVFQSLINYPDTAFDRMVQSESLLDFSFASGNSELMSLRLKMQWDAMK